MGQFRQSINAIGKAADVGDSLILKSKIPRNDNKPHLQRFNTRFLY